MARLNDSHRPEMLPNRRVVVTGMGTVCPLGNNVRDAWCAMAEAQRIARAGPSNVASKQNVPSVKSRPRNQSSSRARPRSVLAIELAVAGALAIVFAR